MSYNTRLIISAAAVLALTATACHREELRPTPAPASSLVLTAGLPEFETQLTKSQPVTADSLFAYPFWSSMTGPSEAVPNNSFADGRYYFMIPSEADRIFFSNISEYLEDINVTTGPEPEILIEYVSDTGSCFGHDLIYGHITEYDAAAAEQSIQMQRAVARITPRLCHVIGEDTVATSLNFYYDSVSLTLGGIYQGVRIDTASLNASYYGSDSFSLPFDVTETACTMDGFYTLPSAEGTPTVSLDLLMEGSQEIVRISAPLPEPILANHDYNMTFYLHRDNMDGGITLDVQMNELVMDVSDTESFDIIEFSSSSLVFEVDAGSSAELTVYSKTGYWSATIPAEVLSYYTVVNTTAGDTATIENPTLNGNSGDVLAFKTLSNISDHETAMILDIPFMAGMAEAADSYDMTLIQSNGQLEQIEITASTSYNISLREAYGIFDIYRTDGTEPELVTSVDGHISDLSLSSGGTYLLSGYYIESLEAASASVVRLLNTPSLSSLHIEYDQASEGLDLSGADRLRSLYLSGNEHITEIDLSGNTELTDIYCSLNGLERLLLSGCTALTSVNTYYSLRYVDVSGCTSLKTLTEDLNQFIQYLDSLDISRSGIEEISIEYTKEQLTYFKLDHCASLKTFYMWAGAYADSLDFTGCTALDSLYIDGRNSIPLTSLSIDGCTSLRTVTLQGMQHFEGFSFDGASINNLYMDDLPEVTILNLDDSDIRNVSIGEQSACGIEILTMDNSTVESLLLKNNRELITLSINDCTHLKVLDIENCDQLNLMYMDGTEAITELIIWSNSISQLPAPDLSKLTELETLLYNNLTTVRRLDLRANTQLRFFNFANLTNFQYLNCDGLSHLEEVHMNNGGSPDTLIMNGCSSLEKLEYGLNCSKSLKHFESDGMTSLKYLHLTRLRLQELNLDMPALEMMSINANDRSASASVLTKIHVNEGNQLKRAYITGTYYLEISNIELNAQNTLTALEIESIYSGTAPESTFDLSGYTALDTLKIGTGSGLHHLNLSGCSSLTLADLDSSPLLTLDITGCDALMQLDLGYTDLIGDELNAVFEQLPARELADGAKFRIAGSPGVGFCNLDIASQKRWALVTDDINGDLEFNF